MYIHRYEGFYEQLWWNSSPSTRNMSYDLRGDPYPENLNIIPISHHIYPMYIQYIPYTPYTL